MGTRQEFDYGSIVDMVDHVLQRYQDDDYDDAVDSRSTPNVVVPSPRKPAGKTFRTITVS